MAFSKHHLYDPTDQLTGNYAHCFSHAARILILKQLVTLGPTVVQVIAKDHPIHRESLAGHLKILRDFNMIEGDERFPYTFYSVHYENLRKASASLSDLINILNTP
jgi:hypothetical protein